MKKIVFISTIYVMFPILGIQKLHNTLTQLSFLLKNKIFGSQKNALFSTKDKWQKEYLNTIDTDTIDILKQKYATIETLIAEREITINVANNHRLSHQEYSKKIILLTEGEILQEIKISLNTKIALLTDGKFFENHHNAIQQANTLTKYYNKKYLNNINKKNILDLQNKKERIFDFILQKKHDFRKIIIKYNEDFLQIPITDVAISNYRKKIILSEEIKTLENIRRSFNKIIIKKINAYLYYYKNFYKYTENKRLKKTINQINAIEEENNIEELKKKIKDIEKQIKALKKKINLMHKKTTVLGKKPINRKKIIEIDQRISSLNSYYIIKKKLLETTEKKIKKIENKKPIIE